MSPEDFNIIFVSLSTELFVANFPIPFTTVPSWALTPSRRAKTLSISSLGARCDSGRVVCTAGVGSSSFVEGCGDSPGSIDGVPCGEASGEACGLLSGRKSCACVSAATAGGVLLDCCFSWVTCSFLNICSSLLVKLHSRIPRRGVNSLAPVSFFGSKKRFLSQLLALRDPDLANLKNAFTVLVSRLPVYRVFLSKAFASMSITNLACVSFSLSKHALCSSIGFSRNHKASSQAATVVVAVGINSLQCVTKTVATFVADTTVAASMPGCSFSVAA